MPSLRHFKGRNLQVSAGISELWDSDSEYLDGLRGTGLKKLHKKEEPSQRNKEINKQ